MSKVYVKVTEIQGRSGYIDTLENIAKTLPDLFDGLKELPGEGYEITVVHMTEEEFDALPEFEGF